MQRISETRRSTLESATAAPAHADSETQYQEQTMNEPCLCRALDCRACRGSDARPDYEGNDYEQAIQESRK